MPQAKLGRYFGKKMGNLKGNIEDVRYRGRVKAAQELSDRRHSVPFVGRAAPQQLGHRIGIWRGIPHN